MNLRKSRRLGPSSHSPPLDRETRRPEISASTRRPASSSRLLQNDGSASTRSAACRRSTDCVAQGSFEARVAVSSVAHRTVGQSIDLDVVALHELTPFLKLLRRRESQVHAEDLALVSQVPLGMPMTVETPAHRHRLFLPRQRHLVDPPVARHAAHALLDVDARGGSRRSPAGRGPCVQTSGLFSARLVRTGSSIGLVAQICEWHDMQVWVGGSPANDDVSTDVWQ